MRYLNGDTDKKISKIGVGTWQFGSREWGYGEQYASDESHVIVRRALELGVTLFDTAETYGFEPHPLVRRGLGRGVAFSDIAKIRGFGRSERILGEALGEGRKAAFVATKFYPAVPFAPNVEQHAVASANRLDVDRLDLYQVHQPHLLVRNDTLMREIGALQRTGLVGEVGISNGSLDRWRDADNALGSRVLSNQVRYSLVDRSAERDLLPFAESQGRIIIAYSPLAGGLLSGKYHSTHRPTDRARASHPLFLPDNLERASKLIAALRAVADAHAATPAQIALAWVIHRPGVAAIPGAATRAQLESNVAAADIELSDSEYHDLQVASEQFQPVPGPTFTYRRFRALFGH